MTLSNTIKLEIEMLRNDNLSGASELSTKAVEIIKSMLKELNSEKNLESLLKELCSQIINARPSMAPLINTIGYLYDNIHEGFAQPRGCNKVCIAVFGRPSGMGP